MTPMRRIASTLAAAALLAVPSTALGHTEVSSSDPADGAVVAEAPEEITITFEGEVGDGSAFTVTGPDGATVGEGELDLDVADRNVLHGTVDISEEGTYTIAYAVVGEDGHEVTGELTFRYEPDGEPTQPDTAVPAPTGSLVAMGLLLAGLSVALFAALGVRRLAIARR